MTACRWQQELKSGTCPPSSPWNRHERKPPLCGGGFLVAPWDDQDESVGSKSSPVLCNLCFLGQVGKGPVFEAAGKSGWGEAGGLAGHHVSECGAEGGHFVCCTYGDAHLGGPRRPDATDVDFLGSHSREHFRAGTANVGHEAVAHRWGGGLSGRRDARGVL